MRSHYDAIARQYREKMEAMQQEHDAARIEMAARETARVEELKRNVRQY